MADERKVLIREVERLARKICELKGLSPDAAWSGLPFWTTCVGPEALEVVAEGNPAWDVWRRATMDVFFGDVDEHE